MITFGSVWDRLSAVWLQVRSMNCIVIIPGYDRVRSNWIGLNCVLKFALPTAGSHDQRAIYKMAIVIDLSKAFADGHFKKYFRAGVTGSY